MLVRTGTACTAADFKVSISRRKTPEHTIGMVQEILPAYASAIEAGMLVGTLEAEQEALWSSIG
jgi:hypothetical protein